MSHLSNTPLPVLVACYKGDYHLTRVCVASIRYFYPNVPIYLVKDLYKGDFDTSELEKYFNVKTIDFNKKNYGWTTTKMLTLLSRGLPFKKVLMLDSDIVFIGRVLDRLSRYADKYEFIVSPETIDSPGSVRFNRYYYNFNYFKKLYPGLVYPGYNFCAGNIVATPGLITQKEVSKFFRPERFPFWTRPGLKHLPNRDQSLLNVLLILRAKKKPRVIKKVDFMWWHHDHRLQDVSLNDVRQGKYPFLVHWAGAARQKFLPAQVRGDILTYFLHYYYLQVPFGKIRYYLEMIYLCIKYIRYDMAVVKSDK